jgi:hypothetical protein
MGPCKAVWIIAVVMMLSARANRTLGDVGIASAVSTFDTSPLFQLSLSEAPVWLDASPGAETKAAASTSPAPATLHKGTWDFELGGAHMSPIRSTRDYFDSASTALGYFIADRFSLNAAVVGYNVDQPNNSAFAGGFDLYARCYFLTLDRFTFFGDLGAGVFMADKEVPERGTHFNFTPRTGLGVGYRLSESLYFLVGGRYWHLSNAGIHGETRNPSFDSVQYYGSIMLTF